MIGLFSRSIFPRRGASAVVTEELARCFGRQEMVVVGGRRFFEKSHCRPASEVNFLVLGSEINVRGRGDRFFEPLRWIFLPIHVARATEFCRRNKCTSIVATFPDELFLYLGLVVAERLKIPFYSYFHNTLVENRSGWRLLLANYVQKRAFAKSRKVFVISSGLEKFYRRQYPDVDFETVPHVIAGGPAVPKREFTLRSVSPKTVALCGNFNQTNIDATIRVINALHATGQYKIILYTPVPSILLRMRGIDVSKISSIDYVADCEFMDRLNQADLLILTHGLKGSLSDIEYQTIFPTRTVSLLSAGRPLLVHAPRQSFLCEYINHWGCGVVVDSADEDAIRAAAGALTSDERLAMRVISRAMAASEMFKPHVVKARLLALLQ